jgi:hypothetical protein
MHDSEGESIRHPVPEVRSNLNRLTRFVLGQIHENRSVEPKHSRGRQKATEATTFIVALNHGDWCARLRFLGVVGARSSARENKSERCKAETSPELA